MPHDPAATQSSSAIGVPISAASQRSLDAFSGEAITARAIKFCYVSMTLGSERSSSREHPQGKEAAGRQEIGKDRADKEQATMDLRRAKRQAFLIGDVPRSTTQYRYALPVRQEKVFELGTRADVCRRAVEHSLRAVRALDSRFPTAFIA